MEAPRPAVQGKRIIDPDRDVIEFGLIDPRTGDVVKIEVDLGAETRWAARPESKDPAWHAVALTGGRVLAARLSL